MKQQIIQCPTDAEMRKEGFCGTTWIITQANNAPGLVYVQHSICSPEDQFSRKKGVRFASLKIPQQVKKQDLIQYINHVTPHKGNYVLPNVYDIYQAVVRL